MFGLVNGVPSESLLQLAPAFVEWRIVSVSPTAQTSFVELPQTPASFDVVPLAADVHVFAPSLDTTMVPPSPTATASVRSALSQTERSVVLTPLATALNDASGIVLTGGAPWPLDDPLACWGGSPPAH